MRNKSTAMKECVWIVGKKGSGEERKTKEASQRTSNP